MLEARPPFGRKDMSAPFTVGKNAATGAALNSYIVVMATVTVLYDSLSLDDKIMVRTTTHCLTSDVCQILSKNVRK